MSELPAAKRQRKIRYFQGLPVREGRGDILVQPTREDIRGAKRHDPENCAYARCLRRMLETKRVYIYTSVAYVETLDERGNAILERYVIKDHAHAYIRAFDRGEDVGPGGFLLHKPTGTKTLDGKKKYSAEYAEKYPEKRREYGRRNYEKTKAAKQKRKINVAPPKEYQVHSFRSGVGQVKFLGCYDGVLGVQHTEEAE